MEIEEEECAHLAEVFEQTKSALQKKDTTKLKELSNQTIHSACNYQDAGSITIAVIIYAVGKLIEREDYMKVKNWNGLEKKLISTFDLAVRALRDGRISEYQEYVQKARNVLTSHAINLRPYIQDVLKKASINKASKIYEHGISLEQTAKLLGISQWELSEYIGQKTSGEEKRNKTLDVTQRAKMAMEFFGGSI